MIEEIIPYSYTNKKYYESVEYADWNSANEWDYLLSKASNDKYCKSINEAYIILKAKNVEYPCGGWKIHVSANWTNMRRIAETVVPLLFEMNVSFKIIRSKGLYQLLSQKSFPRTLYGKFITIYPQNEEQFVHLLEMLDSITKMFDGPRVLTDMRYNNNKILYYRYGGIEPLKVVDSEGKTKYFITDGNGKIIEDKRQPFYTVIDGINCPIEPEAFEKSKLLSLYTVTSAVKIRNSGGIYNAINNATKKKVIIKEARPGTLLDTYGNAWGFGYYVKTNI